MSEPANQNPTNSDPNNYFGFETDPARRQEIKAELSKTLRSAFNNAVYLGYAVSADFVAQALAPIDPLTYLESKGASHMSTAGQWRRGVLDTQKAKLEASAAEANQTAAGQQQYEADRQKFNAASDELERKILQARKDFASDLQKAFSLSFKIADEYPSLVSAVSGAEKYPFTRDGAEQVFRQEPLAYATTQLSQADLDKKHIPAYQAPFKPKQ